MDFLYKSPDELKRNSLGQGDLITKTAQVEGVLRQAHQYYAVAEYYTHFMVITQSCDLVRRKGGEFNAPYITIAAVKPFMLAVDQARTFLSDAVPGADGRFSTVLHESKLRQLLERYLNNTEPDHFFLPASEEAGLAEDLLAYLRLSVALRPDHYDVLASAKAAELADVFQAKVGWLTGNIYSRVATPDIVEKYPDGPERKKDFVSRYLAASDFRRIAAVQKSELKALVSDAASAKGADLTEAELNQIIDDQLPAANRLLASKIVDALARKRNLLEAAQVDRLKLALAEDSTFRSIVSQL